MTAEVRLKEGRQRSLHYRHPWIFSGAIEEIRGEAADGDEVLVVAPDRRPLARGLYNGRSQIAVRVATFDPEEALDEAFWRRCLERAVRRRREVIEDPETDAYRLVHSEADGIPGLIVDRYGGFLVVQLSTFGAERRRELLISLLVEFFSPIGIFLRVDPELHEKEGLELEEGVLHGEAPPERCVIQENGVRYYVDLRHGHKTGFFLDQRENRARLARHARGEILNVFAYTGSFGIVGRRHGCTRATHIESSLPALALAESNTELNGLSVRGDEFVSGNAFEVLRRFRDQARRFDTVVVDPPRLAPSRSHLSAARRAYKDINLWALKLTAPGGRVLTFSCSGAVSPEMFQTILFHASVDVRREVTLIERLKQSSDHPAPLGFPEADYLCGLVLEVE